MDLFWAQGCLGMKFLSTISIVITVSTIRIIPIIATCFLIISIYRHIPLNSPT